MRLELGRNSANQPVLWESTDNANILTVGRSGQGKSVQQTLFASQMLQQGHHIIFIDSANEYGTDAKGKPKIWPPANARFLDVFSPLVPIQTLFPNIHEDGTTERLEFAANRIACTFKMTMGLSDVQTAYLSQKIEDNFDGEHCCSISTLIDLIQADAEEGNRTAKSLSFRFNIFRAFSDVASDWYEPFDAPGVTIINTSSIMDCAAQKTILEVLMSNIWFHKKSRPNAAPIVFCIDECHNISFEPGLTALKLIREGRKYQISGLFSTQWLDKNCMDALGDAGLKIFFHPGDSAMQYALSQLPSKGRGNRAEVRQDLMQLYPGEFLYRPDDGNVTWVNARTEIHDRTETEDRLSQAST